MADEKEAAEEKEAGSKKKLIFIIVGALVLVGAAVGGTLMFVGGGEKAEVAEGEGVEEQAPKDYAYLKFAKPIVVNYQSEDGKTRFLKAEVTLMTEDKSRLDDIEKHLPKLQHTVNLVFSRQKFEDLNTSEGKEKMRTEALTEMQKVLTEEMGEKNVDDLFYTTFVTQ